MRLNTIQVRKARDDDASRWDDYIALKQDGLAYHFFSWKQAVENSYGFECPYFLAEQEGRIYGVLPMVHIHPPFCKGILVSLPYCDVGGIVSDNPEIAESLFNYACQYARGCKIHKIEIRYPSHVFGIEDTENPNDKINVYKYLDPEAPSSGKVRMLLELPGSSQLLLASLKSKVRSQVKKPERDGLIFEIGGIALLDHFYSVFTENMRSLGSPVHSRNWLSNVLNYYGERAKCGVVFMPDKTPAAGGIILCHRNVVSIPWASSLQRFNRFNPNMLLYWSFLEFAADNGYRYFDFGRSTPGEGTYKFKAQWGAKPQPLHWERWKVKKDGVHASHLVTISNSNSHTRAMAEKVIQKIPLPVATFLGSRIRKYISL